MLKDNRRLGKRVFAGTFRLKFCSLDSELLDRAICFACGQLGHDWKLFFAQLGLQSSLLNDCDEEKSIPLKCCRAFDKWRTNEKESATIDILLRALCESDRLGTAEELIEVLGLRGTFTAMIDRIRSVIFFRV